ncbi:hypothetical protein SAMN05216499_119141 [Actinacidiphila paucisporea]|uniref:Uncharacterized protein n=1 Tax=Actinacidiphila paucisporea TaxID=310782 RepID=A0A1M7NS56_9ACTN|nr:hypothetical protein SAMN05216499_119141 [Actinacidiphila paucisporea]
MMRHLIRHTTLTNRPAHPRHHYSNFRARGPALTPPDTTKRVNFRISGPAENNPHRTNRPTSNVFGATNRVAGSFHPNVGFTSGLSCTTFKMMSAASSPVNSPTSNFSHVSAVTSKIRWNVVLSGHHNPGFSVFSNAWKCALSPSTTYRRRAPVNRITPGVMKHPHTRNTAFHNRKCENEINALFTRSSLKSSRPASSFSTYSNRSSEKSSSRNASNTRDAKASTTSIVFDNPRENNGSMNPAACDIKHHR